MNCCPLSTFNDHRHALIADCLSRVAHHVEAGRAGTIALLGAVGWGVDARDHPLARSHRGSANDGKCGVGIIGTHAPVSAERMMTKGSPRAAYDMAVHSTADEMGRDFPVERPPCPSQRYDRHQTGRSATAKHREDTWSHAARWIDLPRRLALCCCRGGITSSA